MDNEQKDLEAIIIELLLGENSIPIKIRNMQNIESDYQLLLKSLTDLMPYYTESKVIDKKLSYSLFDLSNYFTQSSIYYSEKELSDLEDKRDKLYELIIEFYES